MAGGIAGLKGKTLEFPEGLRRPFLAAENALPLQSRRADKALRNNALYRQTTQGCCTNRLDHAGQELALKARGLDPGELHLRHIPESLARALWIPFKILNLKKRCFDSARTEIEHE